MLAAWTVYTSKNGGRKKFQFQIQLGLDIMNYAISQAWDEKSDLPDWMCQWPFALCNCDYFCKNGRTAGIAHKKEKKKVKVVNTRTGLVSWTEACTDVAVGHNKGPWYFQMFHQNNKRAVGKNGKTENPILEVVVWGAFSAARLYAKSVGRRDMIHTSVCVKMITLITY